MSAPNCGASRSTIVNEQAIFKIDKESNLLWRYEAATHHDLAIHPSGEIYALIGLRLPDDQPAAPSVRPGRG